MARLPSRNPDLYRGYQVLLVDVKRSTNIDAVLPHLVYKLPSVPCGSAQRTLMVGIESFLTGESRLNVATGAVCTFFDLLYWT